jgi:hypothetical protein
MLAEIYLLKLEAAARAAKGSGDHGFDLAVCAGHLTGCQGVLTAPFIAPFAICCLQLRRTPRIQNI